ncbi:Ornithine decarboxylase [Balamuthia mandrillaris]
MDGPKETTLQVPTDAVSVLSLAHNNTNDDGGSSPLPAVEQFFDEIPETGPGLRLTFDSAGSEGGGGFTIKAVVVDNMPNLRKARRHHRRQKPKRRQKKSEAQKAKKRLKQKEARKKAREQARSAREQALLLAQTSILATADAEEAMTVFSEPPPSEYAVLREKVLNANKDINVVQVKDSKKVEELLEAELEKGHDTAFYLTDLTNLIEKYLQWKKYLPRATPFYAMKCNPDPIIVRSLVACGTGLDCASKAELQLAQSLGLSPDNVIFAHPCKNPVHLAYAKEHNFKMMTFDNSSELDKIHKLYPDAQVVLRILADDSHSLMAFGSKFGAAKEEIPELIQLCKKLDLKLIGVSFHVGSGCLSGEAFRNSLHMVRDVFDQAKEVLGYELTLVDIGGGWPGVDTEAVNFPAMASVVAPCLDELFPPHVRVIAEPGRYFATETVTLAANIISRRERQLTGATKKQIQYYLSDGVYGSFNNIIFDHAKPNPKLLPTKAQKEAVAATPAPTSEEPTTPSTSEGGGDGRKRVTPEKVSSTLFGPTCDSIDIICSDVDLPSLEPGDWLYFTAMGAYTSSAASSFNGFNPPSSTYIIS